MEIAAWRKVWRDGFAQVIPLSELEALARALASNDPRIVQQAITLPLPLQSNEDEDITACDPMIFGAWVAGKFRTVREAIDHFDHIGYEVDMLLGEPTAVRYVLNWWDDSPREVAVKELYAEVTGSIAEKRGAILSR